ncbi:MAG TPA: NAD(P)H-hydrate dehydratase [Candidatus Baltobacteraceae bacterium]|nr:NAD(P)H-hydrate dehydratase [Candidatus Baltobacteraceae bacterium]
MIEVLTPSEMRDADAQATAAVGAPVLMRAAGAHVAAYIRGVAANGRIVAFAGPGNNGGDAYAALAQLDGGYERIVYGPHEIAGSPARAEAIEAARTAGVVLRPLPETDAAARAALESCACAIDALFGTGARLPLESRYLAPVRALDARERRVIALDIPSGVDALTGAVPGEAVRAAATITLAAMKPGLLFEPARAYCGELWVADIGIDASTLRAHAKTFAALDDAAFLELLPKRARDADKRSAGAPLIIAGSAQFPGAAVLCARAAARAGAGYVTVASTPQAAPALHAHLTEQVVVTFAKEPVEAARDDLLDTAKRNSAAGIGPGLALDDATGAIVRGFAERCELPMVIDASALFHFSKALELLRGKRCVLTPHEGEFARLSGLGTIAPGTRVQRLREFTARTGITTLLKGPATLIDDGNVTHINPTGTSALATAGTGDVLTGIIATLLAQGLSPVDAARAGAYWHGLAARRCAAQRPVGVIAGDLPEALAGALPPRVPPSSLLRYA